MADFKSTTIHDGYGNEAECTLLNQLRVASQVRLAGGVFNDGVLDTNFYTATTAASGTAAVSTSVLTLAVTTASGSTAGVASNRVARYIGSSSNFFRGNIRLVDSGGANNSKYWGAFNGTSAPTSGFFFRMSGTTFSVCNIAVGGSVVAVDSGNFNGKVASWEPGTICHTYEIYYTVSRVQFVVDDILLHSITQTDSLIAGEVHFKANIINANTGVGPDSSVCCMALTVSRLGEMNGSPRYLNISTGTTTLLKTGPGCLIRLVINDPSNTTVTLYDSVTAAGTVIAVVKPGTVTTPITLEYGCDFQNGLTILTSGTINITAIYE